MTNVGDKFQASVISSRLWDEKDGETHSVFGPQYIVAVNQDDSMKFSERKRVFKEKSHPTFFVRSVSPIPSGAQEFEVVDSFPNYRMFISLRIIGH